jgi:hypothetical protein
MKRRRQRLTALAGRMVGPSTGITGSSSRARAGIGVTWSRISVNGQRFDIEAFFRDAGEKNPRPYAGACTVEDNLIEVLADAEDCAHDTLLHEIIHAAWNTSTLKHAIRGKISKKKLTDADLKWIEELVCLTLAPVLLGALRDAGWLQLPRLPKRPTDRTA